MRTVAICLALVLFGSGTAFGTLVAYWNFNDLSTTGGVPSNANQTTYSTTSGFGNLTLNGWTSRAGATAPHGISNFTGTTINAVSPDPAGQSLALQGGTTSGTPNNGATLVLSFSMIGLTNPVLSFATQKTSTGFNSNQVAWSTNGSAFTDFGSPYNPATAFALQSVDLSTVNDLDGATSAYIRITFAGATSSSGNNRLDNIQINAAAVPEPAAVLFGGLVCSVLGLTVAGRRALAWLHGKNANAAAA